VRSKSPALYKELPAGNGIQKGSNKVSKVIDLHSHFVPTSLPDGSGRDSRWPSIEQSSPGEAAIMINNSIYRKIDSRAWDTERRLEDMAADGIDVQVLSPMPELLSTWFSPEDGDVISGAMNEFVATMVSSHPENFLGIGMVPIQDPDLSATRLADIKAMGLIGVEIATHVDGLPLGDPKLDSFYAEAEALDLVVMVHPLRPVGMERIGGRSVVAAATAYPLDTTLAAVSLIAGGVVERFPGLRFMLSHGGGVLPYMLPRLDRMWSMISSASDQLASPPSELCSSFYFDSLVYDARTLAHLIEIVGADRVVMGSDYPFLAQQSRPIEFVESAVSADHASIITGRNAETLLGLSQIEPAGIH
jgi:aminocarboxymuconate-semialdehyde decarboxylase